MNLLIVGTFQSFSILVELEATAKDHQVPSKLFLPNMLIPQVLLLVGSALFFLSLASSVPIGKYLYFPSL